MKKDIIIKIISTIICLGLIIGGYFLIKNKDKNEGGTITIILSDPFNDYYNEKTIEFILCHYCSFWLFCFERKLFVWR